ncbi:hypothetical protein PTSG_01301 [Salpingoeca rosetta]|uniref:XRCC4 N-terminal domain-containing protein n=1 Tax=Salpingoeca rosetta (strain ATCC 50818 / BSB-021) TaxID=946362 RepID=F2TZY3_SALR5|nr:uncharacterized protein PTSG_01301 [Salpingoeca rosetta]EGD80711.1 hypothetical protein PTSG_01301 [Salpingoeca rosetta]|eukprot:XP_004997272.1 hypothetical protein PTSG_01301 [Salpingoeca rosetta]
MALLEVDGGDAGTCYALAQWTGKAGESSLSIAVSNGTNTFNGQMTRRDMRAWIKTTSLEHADYTKHLAQAFSGHNHFYDYVLHEAKELRVKFQAADGIKVLLAKVPLRDITSTEESYQVLAAFVAQHVAARRKVKQLRADIDRLRDETTEMHERAHRVKAQLAKRTKETKLQLISAVNKRKTEIYNLHHPKSPRRQWPSLRRQGSWTRSQERAWQDGHSIEPSWDGPASASMSPDRMTTATGVSHRGGDSGGDHRGHRRSAKRGGAARYHDDDDNYDDDDDGDGGADGGRSGRGGNDGYDGVSNDKSASSSSSSLVSRANADTDGDGGAARSSTLLQLASKQSSTTTGRRRRKKRAVSSTSARQTTTNDDDDEALLLDL